jgi:hypothetical protein
LNFPLKSSEIPISSRFHLASVTINFTDNCDYRAVLYSVPCVAAHVGRTAFAASAAAARASDDDCLRSRSLPIIGNALDMRPRRRHAPPARAERRGRGRLLVGRREGGLRAARPAPRRAQRPRRRPLHDLAAELRPAVEGAARHRGHAHRLAAEPRRGARRPQAQVARPGRSPPQARGLSAAMLNLVSSSFFSVDVVDMDNTESARGIRHHVEEVANLMIKANVSDLFPSSGRSTCKGCVARQRGT